MTEKEYIKILKKFKMAGDKRTGAKYRFMGFELSAGPGNVVTFSHACMSSNYLYYDIFLDRLKNDFKIDINSLKIVESPLMKELLRK